MSPQTLAWLLKHVIILRSYEIRLMILAEKSRLSSILRHVLIHLDMCIYSVVLRALLIVTSVE